jgi:hypothetical protein
MRAVTVEIPEENYLLFLKALEELKGIVKEEEKDIDNMSSIERISQGLREANLMEQGKLKGFSLQDVINEL